MTTSYRPDPVVPKTHRIVPGYCKPGWVYHSGEQVRCRCPVCAFRALDDVVQVEPFTLEPMYIRSSKK